MPGPAGATAVILAASRDQAASTRRAYRTVDGVDLTVDTYMGATPAAAGGRAVDGEITQPMAYLVCQPAGSVIRAHYHQVDQFQLFVRGNGRIGTHAADALTVHYAGAHSPYGPIVAGDQGIEYLTLRRSWDPGAQWMPDCAAALRALPARRHRSLTAQLPCDSTGAPEAGAVSSMRAFGEGEMGTWLVRLGPGAHWSAPASACGAGQYIYLWRGGVDLDDGVLHEQSCLFVDGRDEGVALRAGASGAEVLLLQFGRR